MLSLDVINSDPDIVICSVRTAGESYSAAADVYFTFESLSELADKIAGFPSSPEDRRKFEADYSPRGNVFRLSLECADGAGHGLASIELVDNQRTRQSAVIRFPIIAAEIDEFEKALRTMSTTEKGRAILGSAAKVSV